MKKWMLLILAVSSLVAEEPKVPLVLCVPKAGGHLALKMLKLFPEVPDCQWADHLIHSGAQNPLLRDEGATKILIVRDLRDVFVSLVYWFDDQVQEGLINRHLASKRKGLRERIQHWRGCSFDQKLRIVLEDGDGSLYSSGFMRENIEEGCRLMEEPNVLVVRFEDLVGPRGGGSAEAQQGVIRRVAQELSQKLSEEEIEEIGKGMFGTSQTFRKGQIGSWEGNYSPENLLLFYMRYGRYQKSFGYNPGVQPN